MGKIFHLVGLVSVLFGVVLVSFTVSADSRFFVFDDVSVKHENFQAIDWLSKQKVVNGYSDGTFRPDRSVNRAELLKMVYVLKGNQSRVLMTTLISKFPDVDLLAWYAPYVNYAEEVGTIRGYPDGSFGPGNDVNRAEALQIMLREFFPDENWAAVNAQCYEPYIAFAEKYCLMEEVERLDGAMARKEVAEVLYRIMVFVENGENALCGSEFDYPKAIVKGTVTDTGSHRYGLFYALKDKFEANYNGRIDLKFNDELLFVVTSLFAGQQALFVPAKNGLKLASVLPLSDDEHGLPILLDVSNIDGTYRLRVFDSKKSPIDNISWSDDSKYVSWSYLRDGKKWLSSYEIGQPLTAISEVGFDAKWGYRFLSWIGDRLYVWRFVDGTEDVGSFGYFRFNREVGGFEGQFISLFQNDVTSDLNFAISADGMKVVYSADSNGGHDRRAPYFLYFRDLENPAEPIEVIKNENFPLHSPIWTKDSKYVIYVGGGTIWKLEMATREVRELMDVEVIDGYFGIKHSIKPIAVTENGKTVVVIAEPQGVEFRGKKTVYLVSAVDPTLSLSDLEVLVDRQYLDERSVIWID